MGSLSDYYAVLGVEADAEPPEIKAAFKKLALRYHPDVYKGEDAQERMRVLLQAYQTLNNPEARKKYDASRSEGHRPSPSGIDVTPLTGYGRTRSTEVSPRARRDRQRHYAFPDVFASDPVHVRLGDVSYQLAGVQATQLGTQGLLRGLTLGGHERGGVLRLEADVLADSGEHTCYCHRCHHRWQQRAGQAGAVSCPSCGARDWAEFLLLRCIHCGAIFESEQIRYQIGEFNYGDGALCPPYELFPLCPYCSSHNWCPAEDQRVADLRARAARRAGWVRLLSIGVALIVFLALALLMTSWLPR